MKILLVNDDGIEAPGLLALYQAAKDFGDVTIVAPARQQSATSHSITIDSPLFYKTFPYQDGARAYSVSGTPVDCVKIALNIILEQKPDLVLSGINWGSNLGASIIYSGTVGAALEASFHQIPAIAFSLKVSLVQDFTFSRQAVADILKMYSNIHSVYHGVLNVNIPAISSELFAGYRITHQTHSSWEEQYQTATNGNGEQYHVLSGELLPIDSDENGDILAINNNCVSLTPIMPDFTHYDAVAQLRSVIT